MITPAYSPTATERVLPRLALDFTTGVLDSRVTVTRALNTATRVNSSGFIESVNADIPRFDYDPVTFLPKGLLIEETRSNLHRQSEAFSSPWTTTRASVVSAAVQAPSGVNSVIAFTEDATNNFSHELYQNTTKAASAITYTYSLYVKKAGRDWICVTIWDNSANGNRFWFNVNTGAKGSTTTFGTPFTSATYDIVAAQAGFYKIFMTLTSNTATNLAVTLYSTNADNSTAPAVALNAAGLYVYGSQLEAGAFATSYIPTTTTRLTRNADVVSMTGTNFSDWYNATEGTFMANVSSLGTFAFNSVIDANDGTTLNRIGIRYNSASVASGLIIVNNVQQGPVNPATAPNAAASKFVLAYKADSFAASYRASTVATDTSGTVPTVTQLDIGNFISSSASQLNGHFIQLSYYPLRLTNNEVQAFSK